MKLCECGCGKPTNIAAKTNRKAGWTQGQPRRFLAGHSMRQHEFGHNYAVRRVDGKSQRLHRIRAEKALGKPLPINAIVHHSDGSKSDDAPLVICQDNSYHRLLHARMRVKAAGGNPNADSICTMCKTVKSRSAFYAYDKLALGVRSRCKECLRRREQFPTQA